MEWISSHINWLGNYLGIEDTAEDEKQIWPIVQLADLGGDIPADQVPIILETGLTKPASGIMIFSWGRISEQSAKVQEMTRFFLAAE